MRHFSCCVLFEVAVFKTQTGGGTITNSCSDTFMSSPCGPTKSAHYQQRHISRVSRVSRPPQTFDKWKAQRAAALVEQIMAALCKCGHPPIVKDCLCLLYSSIHVSDSNPSLASRWVDFCCLHMYSVKSWEKAMYGKLPWVCETVYLTTSCV